MDDGDGMDALFNSFMNEVSNIKTTKMKKIEGSAGTPEEIIERDDDVGATSTSNVAASMTMMTSMMGLTALLLTI
eukprot:s1667_g3.t1